MFFFSTLLLPLKDTSDASESLRSNILIQTPTILDNENNEEHDYIPRSTSFLRFGRKLPPPFLRFGRTQPTTFLRFGRSQPTYLRFGKMGQFLRFG